ncbi:MAG: MBL fold metallo-hydrolase [Pyrinomonadaceae bacterium MAG19_C2-C3]|nr:MBL fold metallo-hydrolase [Pyrinomonadaceae bacterium MAG19_C2-C3]
MEFGDYRVEILATQNFGLDGGAMFGVVPRVLWSKVMLPDDQNRIRMTTNCVYIEAGDERIIVDTGMGDKWTDKLRAIYNVAETPTLNGQLENRIGIMPEDITIVVNTHLHFDHCGGNTRRDERGGIVPAFPNARYMVSRREYEHARNPFERDRASYMSENWEAIAKSGQLELCDDDYEIVSGLTMETVTGHNQTMQCMRLTRDGRTLFNFVDLAPTRFHVQPAWLMGYDLYPVETLANKKRLLPQAAREDWLCVFMHDPDAPLYRVVETEGKLKAFVIEEGEA